MSMIVQYANQMMGYIMTIKMNDIIDIAIIAYLIYRLLMFTRKSQTGQVLKGIILVLIVMWLAYQFKLHVLSFILSKAIEIGLLALVVVFHPEIRRFLEQVGSRGFKKIMGEHSTSSTTERAIMQLVEAYSSMSRDHIGALVVFERNTILDDSIKSGTMVDAEVSGELLKNIFWPNAPLHDGAVIIRNGRVLSAGCVLPLTSNLNVSRDLGTRHRAGIGASEHSDAVVAIVSEETGSISVAIGGMLKRHLSLETLERLLRNELILPEDEVKTSKLSKLSGVFRRKKGGDSNVE